MGGDPSGNIHEIVSFKIELGSLEGFGEEVDVIVFVVDMDSFKVVFFHELANEMVDVVDVTDGPLSERNSSGWCCWNPN